MLVIYWLADGAQADLVLANIHCLCSFRPSFLPCCNGFGLLPPSLVSSAFSEKFLFWDQMRYFGRPFYSGGPHGSWRLGLLGLLGGDPWRLSVGPVAAMVPSNYSFY